MSWKTLEVSYGNAKALPAIITHLACLVSDGVQSGDVFSKISKTETDEGTEIVREFFAAWKSKTATEGSDGDVNMLSEEEQLVKLRETVEEFKEKMDGNPWVQAVLENF